LRGRVPRRLDVELVAQAQPDVRVTAVPRRDIAQVRRRVAAGLAGTERGSAVLGIRTGQDQVGDQVVLERRANGHVRPLTKPLRIWAARAISAVRRPAVGIEERLLSRVWVTVARQSETQFLEEAGIRRDVRGNVVPARPVARTIT